MSYEADDAFGPLVEARHGRSLRTDKWAEGMKDHGRKDFRAYFWISP
jgi:hypothetical protein